jgi:hypothetical protein
MSINDAITKAIQENLPAATAGELNKFITQAEATKRDLDHYKNLVETKDVEIQQYKAENEHLKNVAKVYGDLNTREKAIIAAEVNLKLIISEHKAIEAEKRADAIYKLAEKAFGNRAITKMVSTSVPVYTPYAGGGGVHEMLNGLEYHNEQEVDDAN